MLKITYLQVGTRGLNYLRRKKMGKRVGFIGAGNMAQAIIGGVTHADLISRDEIIASGRTHETVDRVSKIYGVSATTDNCEVAKADKMLFLCVKPKNIPEVISQIKDIVKEDTVIISIAAGVSTETLEKLFGRPLKIIRVMPNLPAIVGAGVSEICANSYVTDDEKSKVVDIFNCLGNAYIVKEQDMDVVSALSGGSPAFVAMFIEALADGAVAEGMHRDMAYELAARTVAGTARLIVQNNMHPAILKDKVCSPGGTTIEGVDVLENSGFRGSVMEAIRASSEKSKEMARRAGGDK